MKDALVENDLIDNTDTIVLMKCVNCAFLDLVPDLVLDEMGDVGIEYEGLEKPGIRMYCPYCVEICSSSQN